MLCCRWLRLDRVCRTSGFLFGLFLFMLIQSLFPFLAQLFHFSPDLGSLFHKGLHVFSIRIFRSSHASPATLGPPIHGHSRTVKSPTLHVGLCDSYGTPSISRTTPFHAMTFFIARIALLVILRTQR